MRRGLIFSLIIALLLISFVSAQYGQISFSNLLSSIEASTLILGVLFIVFFAVIYFGALRVFRREKGVASVVSFALSLLITYGINKTGLNIEGFFYNLGLSSDFLYVMVPLIFIALAIFMGIKFGFGVVLCVIGGGAIILSLTNLIYEKGIVIFIGVVLIILGIWLIVKKKRKISSSYPMSWRGPQRRSGPSGRRGRRGGRGPRGGRGHPGERGPRGGRGWRGSRGKTGPRGGRGHRGETGPRTDFILTQKIDAEKEARREETRAREYKRQERRRQQQARLEQKQQKQIEQQQRLQITSNLKSLIRTYNEIQRQDPSDPRLIEIAKEVKRLRREKR